MTISLALLRITLLLHAALIVLQPVMAGYFLAGEVDAMSVHSPIGSLVWMLAFLQIFVAALYWLAGRGRGWPVLASIGLFLAEMTQMTLGHTQTMSVHIPLGTSIVVAVLLLTIWSFRPSARQVRPRRVHQQEVAR
ncbi:hypothetical protein [Kribbella deserti]|uniref:Uncharacterized protein n=1 Tax=Kribbella deserti TaxID=1926257 RepID=A0ABV6QW76_9ACTN